MKHIAKSHCLGRDPLIVTVNLKIDISIFPNIKNKEFFTIHDRLELYCSQKQESQSQKSQKKVELPQLLESTFLCVTSGSRDVAPDSEY